MRLLDEYGYLNLWIIPAGVAVGFVALLMLAVAVGYAVTSTRCGDFGDQIGRDTTFSFWTGCYVRVGDGWVPDDNWRIQEQP